MASRIIFVTGTDTGVGKTLLTGLLLCHLRNTGCRVLAMKPFSSGGRADAELLRALQEGELSLDEINPFHFREPLAPLVAARKHGRSISLREVTSRIQRLETELGTPGSVAGLNALARQRSSFTNRATPTLLIEGSGGLLAPLGERYSGVDLVKKLKCEVAVVSRNRLGTLNHTLLTVQTLRQAQIPPSSIKVVLMNGSAQDGSCGSNPDILGEILAPVALFSVPFLGSRSCTVGAIKKSGTRIRRTLARILKK